MGWSWVELGAGEPRQHFGAGAVLELPLPLHAVVVQEGLVRLSLAPGPAFLLLGFLAGRLW